MFRYHDRPGMLGRVGTLFGANNVNIASSIVGRQPEGAEQEAFAAMIVTTDCRRARRADRARSRPATDSSPASPSRSDRSPEGASWQPPPPQSSERASSRAPPRAG